MGLAYDNLSKANEAYGRWTGNVAHDIDTWFTDKGLVQEFLEGSLIPPDENDSHADEKDRFAETMGCQQEWLSTVARRIPDFPQADNTPQVSHGR